MKKCRQKNTKKRRYIHRIIIVCLLLSVFPAIAWGEMDYGTVYETAIQLASNDLSNIHNLQDAAVMLEQTGSYMQPFTVDLEARNLPACIDLIAYVKARMLEDDVEYNEAFAAYRKMVIMDAPDRAVDLATKVKE